MGSPSLMRGAPGTLWGPDQADQVVATAPAGTWPCAGSTLAMDSLCTSLEAISWSYSPSTTVSVVLGKADTESQVRGHPGDPRPPTPPHGHPTPT